VKQSENPEFVQHLMWTCISDIQPMKIGTVFSWNANITL